MRVRGQPMMCGSCANENAYKAVFIAAQERKRARAGRTAPTADELASCMVNQVRLPSQLPHPSRHPLILSEAVHRWKSCESDSLTRPFRNAVSPADLSLQGCSPCSHVQCTYARRSVSPGL
jgi:hypothetical protein